jgi:Sortase domain
VKIRPGVRGRSVQGRPRGRRANVRWRWAGLAGILAALGTALLVTAAMAQENPPAPPHDLGAIPVPGSLATGSSAAKAGGRADTVPAPVTLPRSQPVSLAIPAIGVHTSLIKLGLAKDHTLQVPPLTAAGVKQAGWYDRGPTPGQAGPAVIAGHVDSYQGPGVFYRLGALKPGDQIDVTRADGTVADFQVDAVDEYSKDKFPTRQVYGPVSYAGLRVITCGGQFDSQTRHYLSNVVIYATLTASHPVKKPVKKPVKNG